MRCFIFVLFLFLSGFLTACSGTTGPQLQDASITSTQITSEDIQVEAATTTLENFVNALNNHQVNQALDLFNEESVVSEVNLTGSETNSLQINLAQSWKNKAEIKDLLEYEAGAINEIVPIEFKASAKTITLKTLFYYNNQVRNIDMDVQAEGGKLIFLRLFIERITWI